MNELALFAGAGGGILGGHLLGWRTVCAVEWEPYAACVLAARQNDKVLPPFPIWDDVQTFDGKPWRGIVDVVSGGFPCQDISAAGKGAGIDGERSGMWKEMARIIGEVRPRFVFVENSPMLTSRGLGTVLGDLAALGFDAEWGVVSAADTGAPHLRERIWIVGTDTQQRGFLSHAELQRIGRREQQPKSIEEAEGAELANTNLQHGQRRGKSQHPTSVSGETWNQFGGRGDEMADSNLSRCQQSHNKNEGWTAKQLNGNSKSVSNSNVISAQRLEQKSQQVGIKRQDRLCHRTRSPRISDAWPIEPNVGRVANGVAARVDRLKALGNGQVPRVAATAFELLNET